MDVNLIPLIKEDIELVRSWRNLEEVSKFMYTDDYISKENQEKWFGKVQESQTSRYWVIVYKGSKLGLAYLTGIDFTLKSCFWGFYISDSSSRGSGVGSKVEFSVIEYVFNELKLHKLRCEVFASNTTVISMHEKFGFRREAYFREHCLKGNKKLDVVGLGLLRKEWSGVREELRKKIFRN